MEKKIGEKKAEKEGGLCGLLGGCKIILFLFFLSKTVI